MRRADGWHDYLFGDPAPANALIKKDNPDMSADIIAQSIAKMKSYGLVASGDAAKTGIGAMTDARWTTFFDSMADEGIYAKTLDWHAAYTLRFVGKNMHTN